MVKCHEFNKQKTQKPNKYTKKGLKKIAIKQINIKTQN